MKRAFIHFVGLFSLYSTVFTYLRDCCTQNLSFCWTAVKLEEWKICENQSFSTECNSTEFYDEYSKNILNFHLINAIWAGFSKAVITIAFGKVIKKYHNRAPEFSLGFITIYEIKRQRCTCSAKKKETKMWRWFLVLYVFL